MSRNLWARILGHLCCVFRTHWGTAIERYHKGAGRKPSWMLTMVSLAAVAIYIACNVPTEESTAGPATDTSSRQSVASAMVGAEGGTLTVDHGPLKGTKLEIQPGALKEPVLISIAELTDMVALPLGNVAAGPSATFEPDGLIFAIPATVTLPTTTPADYMYWQINNGTDWTVVQGATYDPERSVIVGQVVHFCHGASGKNAGKGEGKPENKPNHDKLSLTVDFPENGSDAAFPEKGSDAAFPKKGSYAAFPENGLDGAF